MSKVSKSRCRDGSLNGKLRSPPVDDDRINVLEGFDSRSQKRDGKPTREGVPATRPDDVRT